MQHTLRTPIILCTMTLVAVAAFALFTPHIARAQAAAPGSLPAVIRAELLSDPRTASLSQAQLDAMVSLLTKQAQKQGLTAADITWHPQPPVYSSAPAAPVASCSGDFTCMMDEAFGLVGPDTTIPFSLGAASMGLVWILAEMIHRRKYPHVSTPPVAPSGM